MKLTGDEKAKAIREKECTTKDEALELLQKRIDRLAREAEDTTAMPPLKHKALRIIYLTTLYKMVKRSILIDPLPDCWTYDFDLNYDELSLKMHHIGEYSVDDHGKFKSLRPDATYKLIVLHPNSFTVEQYAELCDVGQGTVRQWIRRGKIRTAFKEGNEWKIPELTAPPERGYEPAQYLWNPDIDNLPSEYEYLNDYVLATFWQDRTERAKYHVLLVARETLSSDDPGKVAKENNKELLLDAKEREKLELFMIGHPEIKYSYRIM